MGSNPRLRERLGLLFAADAPCVAVSFDDRSTEAEVAAASASGMDVAEFRIDGFASCAAGHVAAHLGRFSDVATIATIRSTAEGGAWTRGDDERLALFETVAPLVDAVDVEASSTAIAAGVVAAAHAQQRHAIVSFHDFDRTPTDSALAATIVQARDLGADVVKVATMVHTADDLRTLARVLCNDHGVALIVIGMGPMGAPSRLLFPTLGSRLTFASLGRPSAPGQLSLAETAATLRSVSPAYAARHPA